LIAKLPDLDEWENYFLKNKSNLQKITWNHEDLLSKEERNCISRSIAKFQLGEYSEGKKLIEFCEKYSQKYEDTTLKKITSLFIKEEQAHSYILKRFMELNNITTLKNDWSDNMFRLIRSLSGYELSITVLITAEIIALTYYKALSKATKNKLLKNICQKIIEEERKHVLYESMLLKNMRKQKLRISQFFIFVSHKFFFFCSVLIVLIDHRNVILRGGFNSYSFLSKNIEEFDKAFK
tara:strand:+ start:327 stop:1037 length:711 start_codon:yes stop_codon:yes gene_type:complete